MASATDIPENHPREPDVGEDEPLLGRPGDASQKDGGPLYWNVILGTAIIAQGGVLLLTALVWSSVFLHPLSLFSAHPLLNSSAILLLTESILVLQPTHTANQKRSGTVIHFTLNQLALDAMIAAFLIIEYNKFDHNAIHFTSVHGILGLITYILLFIQALVGFTAYFVPRLYGGADKAKSLYKWHRLSGYVVFLLILATVCAATQTDTGKGFLRLRLWAVLASSVLILIGVLPRIKKQKFGFASRTSATVSQ